VRTKSLELLEKQIVTIRCYAKKRRVTNITISLVAVF